MTDTLGMRPFWLPDLQVHFFARGPGVERGLETDEVGGFLFNTAKYLFEMGDVIEDGHTLEGLPRGRGVRWKCRHELSLTSPRRLVLDADPSPRRTGPASALTTDWLTPKWQDGGGAEMGAARLVHWAPSCDGAPYR